MILEAIKLAASGFANYMSPRVAASCPADQLHPCVPQASAGFYPSTYTRFRSVESTFLDSSRCIAQNVASAEEKKKVHEKTPRRDHPRNGQARADGMPNMGAADLDGRNPGDWAEIFREHVDNVETHLRLLENLQHDTAGRTTTDSADDDGGFMTGEMEAMEAVLGPMLRRARVMLQDSRKLIGMGGSDLNGSENGDKMKEKKRKKRARISDTNNGTVDEQVHPSAAKKKRLIATVETGDITTTSSSPPPTSHTPVSLPDRHKSHAQKRPSDSRSPPTFEQQIENKPKKSKTKHHAAQSEAPPTTQARAISPAPETETETGTGEQEEHEIEIEYEDISAEVTARLREKEEKRRRKLEEKTKRRRSSDGISLNNGVAGSGAVSVTSTGLEKPKKKKVKRSGSDVALRKEGVEKSSVKRGGEDGSAALRDDSRGSRLPSGRIKRRRKIG
ncbi:MAG: hypothetical protein M1819_006987 [Sarea resinae]|nr:MAG: hypothetical protein M1819_006987 [Sarea resinae]